MTPKKTTFSMMIDNVMVKIGIWFDKKKRENADVCWLDVTPDGTVAGIRH